MTKNLDFLKFFLYFKYMANQEVYKELKLFLKLIVILFKPYFIHYPNNPLIDTILIILPPSEWHDWSFWKNFCNADIFYKTVRLIVDFCLIEKWENNYGG